MFIDARARADDIQMTVSTLYELRGLKCYEKFFVSKYDWVFTTV